MVGGIFFCKVDSQGNYFGRRGKFKFFRGVKKNEFGEYGEVFEKWIYFQFKYIESVNVVFDYKFMCVFYGCF